MQDRYKRFVPHEDNVEEIISADHVNELQDQSEINQAELYRQDDIDFLDRALFVLENHTVVNAMYVDLLENITKLDIENSPGISFDPKERAVSLAEGDLIEATLLTKPFQNLNNTNITDLVFMASANIPEGAKILYEISNNGLNYYPIIPNEANVFQIPTLGSQMRLRIRFFRSPGMETPVLKNYAVLYRDAKHVVSFATLDLEKGQCVDCGDAVFEGYSHKDLVDVGPDDHHPQEHTHDGKDGSGLISHTVLTDIGEDDHHAKNHQHGVDGVDLVNLETDIKGTLGVEHLSYLFFTGEPGDLELIRNPLADDKLVKVLSPDSETYLIYDWDNGGRLKTVMAIYDGVATIETFNYGIYTNSFGQTEEVMMGTVKEIRDATDLEVQTIVTNIMAPKPAPTMP